MRQVAVLDIRGPFSDQQTLKSATMSNSVERPPKASVSFVTLQAACKPHRSASKEPQTPSTMGDQVSRRIGSTQRLIGHAPRLRPLCMAGGSVSVLTDCLIIRSLHLEMRKTKPKCAKAK
ncbi:hypothetical protein CgunFtcFv8_027095 [Champsocephalus gunnari]|uniref:Uncharacterized protein n=1 Tax=Champsocephalus gunnari TaxID=52237 RepID=A0AAN8DX26_CHAGU|nr:hypothetical protein CgunFtcFv8_027095 [Champsocephalus gunnari]